MGGTQVKIHDTFSMALGHFSVDEPANYTRFRGRRVFLPAFVDKWVTDAFLKTRRWNSFVTGRSLVLSASLSCEGASGWSCITCITCKILIDEIYAYTFVINYLPEIEIEFDRINFIFVTLVTNKKSQYKM